MTLYRRAPLTPPVGPPRPPFYRARRLWRRHRGNLARLAVVLPLAALGWWAYTRTVRYMSDAGWAAGEIVAGFVVIGWLLNWAKARL